MSASMQWALHVRVYEITGMIRNVDYDIQSEGMWRKQIECDDMNSETLKTSHSALY